MADELMKAALDYAARGFRVFPLAAGLKIPLISAKEGGKGCLDATTDLEQIKAWWKKYPKANIGLAPDQTFFVVDYDCKGGQPGLETLAEFKSQGLPMETLNATTPTGGKHFVYKAPQDVSVGNKNGTFPGVDIKTQGGYIVVEPSKTKASSKHDTIDGIYQWVNPSADILLAPDWFITKIKEAQKEKTNSGATVFQLPERITANRNDTLFRAVCQDLKLNNNVEGAWIRIQEINLSRCSEPLQMSELTVIFNSAVRIHEKSSIQEKLTDLGNAERLIRKYGDRFQYVPEFKKWLLWDGCRWVTDTPSGVKPLAFKTVRDMIEDARDLSDERRTALIRHSLKSESRGAIEAMISLAEAIPGVPIQQSKLDLDHDLLNMINGTIDLKTGILRSHNKSDYITRRAAVEYDPHAKCPTWEGFLNRVMDGDQELIHYIQKAVGYSLTGHTREQCLFIPYGEGSNGKSVFLKTIEYLMADYSTHCPAEALMVKGREGGVNNDIARLRGARFVAAVETDEGKRLSESLIKEMTGGDTITARFLFTEFFEFIPAFKVWLACNHKPVIRGTDHAIWRRIRLIPFLVTIPEAEQDKELADKLKAEASGIMAWAVRGCMKWRAEGLKSPDKVMMATAEYRSEMDTIGAWIDECCKIGQLHYETGASVLYENYKQWAASNGEWVMSQKKLSLKLTERGYQKNSKSSGAFYIGIRIKTKADEEQEKEEYPF